MREARLGDLGLVKVKKVQKTGNTWQWRLQSLPHTQTHSDSHCNKCFLGMFRLCSLSHYWNPDIVRCLTGTDCVFTLCRYVNIIERFTVVILYPIRQVKNEKSFHFIYNNKMHECIP